MKVLTPDAVRRALPVSEEALATVRSARESLEAGRPFAVVAGPETLRDPQHAFDHARRLRRLTDPAGELLVLLHAQVDVLVQDPSRNGSRDLNLGLATARQLLVRINELGLPCALEADSFTLPYLADLIAWEGGAWEGSAAGDSGAQGPGSARGG